MKSPPLGEFSNKLLKWCERASGGIGIRARLKIVSRKGCGFDAHLAHHNWRIMH